MNAPSDPDRRSGVREHRSAAAHSAIELTREAFALVTSSPERASELWQAASYDMERAARAEPSPAFASDLLWAAASLAMHGGDQARAASLSAEAVAWRAYFASPATSGEPTTQVG